MHINLIGLVASVLALVAFAVLHRLSKTWKLNVRVAAAGVLLLLSTPGILAILHYLHLLPEQAWFYELRSWRGSELFMILPGALAGVAANLIRVGSAPFWMFLVAVATAVPFLKPVLHPLSHVALEERWAGNVCLQSSFSTCGPACVATILRGLGCSATEKEIAAACYSYAGGTEAWYLARFVRSQGLSAEFVFRDGLAADMNGPCLAGVQVGPSGHFIVLLKNDGREVAIADPLVGEERLSARELKQRYRFTGFYMTVSKM